MSPRSPHRDPFAYGSTRRGTFSAWTMAIVFATVAMVSFAIDQTLVSRQTPRSKTRLHCSTRFS